MKPSDRARLTVGLRDQVAKIAADLRAKMRAPGPSRARAEQLHADERVAEDFEVWTDLLSRRASVLWVLKSVYVRVIEDRGLLAPGRLLDPEAQQLFERLAPNLGETAFLRWIYRDLASSRGGLPELFSPQPAEVALPSDDLSRALIAFWRHRDADSGAVWSFADERFEGELMGDLYQELDPVVKDRFALCQTPDFVRAFILDRTLTPAIETFGADEVRLLDPACGSGHFLIDGLKRLVAATAAKHPDWDREKIVAHAFDRVVGIDLNDYAGALARTRLIMTAAELAGVSKLADAARFHPHVYWGDGLEQVECEEQKMQYALFEKVDEKLRASLTRPEARAALQAVLKPGFQVVVANPPYIFEGDEARKAYHREKLGRRQRYVSAYKQYHLSSPFTERCFHLTVNSGWVGLIIDNQFMKRDFGRPLIEQVLGRVELSLVADTSQAHIPFHGTPTVIIFGRNRAAANEALVRVVMGRRGETETPSDAAQGRVWVSIVDHWHDAGYENEYVSVVDLPRKTLAKHPWSLQGGGAGPLKERISSIAPKRLSDYAKDIGRTNVCGEDPVYTLSPDEAERLHVAELVRPFAIGEVVRDWRIKNSEHVLYPYQTRGGAPIALDHPAVANYFWRFRALLGARSVFGKSTEDRGDTWFGHLEHYTDRLKTPLSIGFAFVSTHNQFVLDREEHYFNRSAPVIKLSATATEDEHLTVLGLLNSSTLGFWMRQVFHAKGGESTGKKRQSESWSRRLEYDATKLQAAPMTDRLSDRVVALARRIDALGQRSEALSPSAVLNGEWGSVEIGPRLRQAAEELNAIRLQMVALQEELDWTVYTAFGLVDEPEPPPIDEVEPLASEHRPFAIRLARSFAEGSATRYWFDAMGVSPSQEVPSSYQAETQERLRRRLAVLESNAEVGLLEAPEFKRKWEPLTYPEEVQYSAFHWLARRVEAAMRERARPATLPHLVAAVQDDAKFIAVAQVYKARRDVDLLSLVGELVQAQSVPNHPWHTYTATGLAKRGAWEEVWALQRRQDAGERISKFPVLPEYSQGSRGKSTDFLRNEYWQLRGRLDVPRERFIAFTEVPGRAFAETLYGWAGWLASQRLKAILAIDEELEDAGVTLADRIGLLDSAWRLLPDVAREDAAVAPRLKAELQALVGPEGPSRELIGDWKKRFPPPTARATRTKQAPAAREEDDSETQEIEAS
jgi:hypothetical protein